MAADKVNLTWGDAVTVVRNAPENFRPLETGSVCGMRLVDTLELSEKFSVPLGTFLCLVEFSSGASVEIPEFFLSKHSGLDSKF